MALRIGIVGAGLGGLAAAIAFRRQGHVVDVFEASTFSREVGAALAVPANATRVLKGLGGRIEHLKGIDMQAITMFPPDGGPAVVQNLGDALKTYGTPSVSSYRPDIHNELRRLAFEEEGDGPPARLHLSHKASTCDAALGRVVFANGEHYEGDVIIGADGIRSTLRTIVAGKEVHAPPSKYAAFRWLIDPAKLDGKPEFDWVFREGVSGPRMIRTGVKLLLMYPCHDGAIVNVVLYHPDERDQDAVDWNTSTTRAELMTHVSDFHPKYQAFVALAPDELNIWQIRTIPSLPSYVNGHVALLGDAAHAMYTTLGQGAATSLEDGGALGRLFPMGTKRADVVERLEAYDRIRRPRDEFIRRESYEQVAIPEKRGRYMSSREMQDTILGFDALNLQVPVSHLQS